MIVNVWAAYAAAASFVAALISIVIGSRLSVTNPPDTAISPRDKASLLALAAFTLGLVLIIIAKGFQHA